MRARSGVYCCFKAVLTALLLTFVAGAASQAVAQSTAFTYQGSLDDAGAPASGLHDFRFRLFSVASGGTPIGSTLCVDNVSVVEGVFTVQLDFGQQFATTAQRHLEIEVRRDTGLNCTNLGGFVIMAPRQQLTATPMASHANSAFSLDAADGSPTSAVFVDNSGNVGIGTTAPGATLHIKTPDQGVLVQGSGSGSANTAWIGFNDANGTAMGWVGDGSIQDTNTYLSSYVADVILYTSSAALTAKANGSVGIGTQSPAAKLDVRGDIKLGPAGELQATSSGEKLRIIKGRVFSDGTPSGSGFTSTRTSVGVYSVTFDQAFSFDVPSVTVTPEWILGIPLMPMVTVNAGPTLTVRLFELDGTPANNAFNFIAIGRR